MANRNWHDRLVAALRRQGLPNDYVDRLAAELADHATDISLEEASMEAQMDDRLGSPGELALVAIRQFQQRTFAGRHPVIAFLAGPIVTLAATFVISFLLIAAFVLALDLIVGTALGANDVANLPPTPFEMGLMQTANTVVRFLPFASTSLIFYYLGCRTGRRAWGTVACGIVAITALGFHSAIHPPGVYDVQGTWVMGLALHHFGIGQIFQAAVPAVCGIWLLFPQIRPQKTELA